MNYNEYAEAVDVLNTWAKAYADGNQMVEDNIYDSKYREIKQFEMEHPSFILDNSPTRHIIDGAEGFRKVEHKVPMISISNANGIEEATEWVTGMHADHGVKEYMLEYKLDGGGLALIYKDGVLVDAVTRGVDNVGDSIWENAIQIGGVLHNIDLKGDFEVRGEVLWDFEDFDTYNDSLAEQGKKLLSNPRNGATGTMKLHDPKEVANRKIHFVAYHIVSGVTTKTQEEDIELLERLGFAVPPHNLVTIDNFVEVAEDMRSKRYDMPFPIDGIVIKVNDKALQKEIGYSVKSPNFFRAYKFPPEERDTEVIGLELSAGMSGAITPVVIVKPVRLAMTTVQRCSLHNWDIVEYLGLHRGCHVTIRKAGEIIPEIVKCVETGVTKEDYSMFTTKYPDTVPPRYTNSHAVPSEPYIRPKTCPFCGHTLRNDVNADGYRLVAWVCDNPDCDAQLVGKLVNFCSRDTMNIKGMGESTIQNLVDAGKVKHFHDLYDLTVDDFIGIGNIREKRAKQLVVAIQKSKDNYLHQLIEGFSIPDVGHQASPVIAQVYSNLSNLVQASTHADVSTNVSGLMCNGLGNVLSQNFAKWIATNHIELEEMLKRGVAMEAKHTEVLSNKLAGKVCIMTGVFDALDRDVFKSLVIKHGGTICSSITKKTNVVLMGNGAGPSKLATIKKLQAAGQRIDIYTPETLDKFMELIG